jgi:adenylate cyclase class 2
MGMEIEAKMKVEDFDAVRKSLADNRAEHVGAVFETNAFFDTADRSLLHADKGLRLRTAKDPKSGGEKYVITVKGAQGQGQLKTREESEINVDSGHNAREVLTALGYEPTLSFQKRRESWKLGGCKIELDELPILGRFVEIEGPDEQTVMRVRQSLHLDDHPLITTGYISMLAKYLADHHDDRRSITF